MFRFDLILYGGLVHLDLPDGKHVDDDGDVVYVKNKLVHNDDGPAIIWDGDPTRRAWYLAGEKYTSDEFIEKQFKDKPAEATLHRLKWLV